MLKDVNIAELPLNPFQTIGKDWMLVTARMRDRVNTMTASWGGLGVLWNRNVATIVIRPQRYTKEFVDFADSFSLSVLPETYRSALNYLGTKSGRDEDKIKECGLTIAASEGDVPYFEEARLVLVCKKLYAQPMLADCFIDDEMNAAYYPDADYHTLYVGEIVRAMVNEP